jgi:hypothetical protein
MMANTIPAPCYLRISAVVSDPARIAVGIETIKPIFKVLYFFSKMR